MILSAHTAIGFCIGLIIAKTIQEPAFAIPTAILSGVASHYIFDAIPHGHIYTNFEHNKLFQYPLVILDIFGGLFLFTVFALVIYGLRPELLVVLTGIVGSIITDVINGLSATRFPVLSTLPLLSLDSKIHKKTHWHGIGDTTRPMEWYDIWQIGIIAAGAMAPFLLKSI